jgi:hypothetical protein
MKTQITQVSRERNAVLQYNETNTKESLILH